MSQPMSVEREAAVLIIDDHAPIREAISVCIKRSFPGISVIEAPNGATAMKYLEAHCPSLVLMDINLPDANGLDLTRDILKQRPGTFVVVISIDSSSDVTERAQAVGAVQFVGKDQLFASLLPLVGAAVTLANWTKNLESHFDITDKSLLYGGHRAANLLETDVLRLDHD